MSIDFAKIKELQAELDALLDERPEYRTFQKQIEEAMNKAGSRHNRMVVISQMMMESATKMKEALRRLRNAK